MQALNLGLDPQDDKTIVATTTTVTESGGFRTTVITTVVREYVGLAKTDPAEDWLWLAGLDVNPTLDDVRAMTGPMPELVHEHIISDVHTILDTSDVADPDDETTIVTTIPVVGDEVIQDVNSAVIPPYSQCPVTKSTGVEMEPDAQSTSDDVFAGPPRGSEIPSQIFQAPADAGQVSPPFALNQFVGVEANNPTPMLVYLADYRCGAGKTYAAACHIADLVFKHHKRVVYVTERTVGQDAMEKTIRGVNRNIDETYFTTIRGDIRKRLPVLAQFRDAVARGDRIILMTHEALRYIPPSDLLACTRYHLIVDEELILHHHHESNISKEDGAEEFFGVFSFVPSEVDGYHRMELTAAGVAKFAACQSSEDKTWLMPHIKRLAAGNISYFPSRLLEGTGLGGKGSQQRIEVLSLVDITKFSPFKSVTVMGDGIKRSLMRVISENKFNVRFMDHPDIKPSEAHLTPANDAIESIVYLKEENVTMTWLKDNPEKMSLMAHAFGSIFNAEASHPDAKMGLLANNKFMEPAFKDIKCHTVTRTTPKQAGSNEFREKTVVGWSVVMRPKTSTQAALEDIAGINDHILHDTMEMEASQQYVHRSKIREAGCPNGAISVVCLSKQQAVWLAIRNGVDLSKVQAHDTELVEQLRPAAPIIKKPPVWTPEEKDDHMFMDRSRMRLNTLSPQSLWRYYLIHLVKGFGHTFQSPDNDVDAYGCRPDGYEKVKTLMTPSVRYPRLSRHQMRLAFEWAESSKDYVATGKKSQGKKLLCDVLMPPVKESAVVVDDIQETMFV